jgi:hypothetical protein
MGISLSWVAVKGLQSEQALLRLSLKQTAKKCEYLPAGIASHVLPENWFLVTARRCDHRLVKSKSMSGLSVGCVAVACNIEEHVDFTSSELWQNGTLVWRIEHQGEEDPENLSATGELPIRFHELLSSVESQDSENLDGHFHADIPLILAKEFSGFRHDETNPAINYSSFEELSDLLPRNSWWKLWK